MKPLFLQVRSTDPDYDGMVTDHQPRHMEYCRRHGYDYLAEEPLKLDPWLRIKLCLKHIVSGEYSHVFWVDSDVFVADMSRDMRETLPYWAFLAMTIHPYHWRTPEPWHFQTGMFYWSACKMAEDFIVRVLESEGCAPDDQTVINRLLMEEGEVWQRGLNIIPYRWNNTLHDQTVNPIVAAFHGAGNAQERRASMMACSKAFPFEVTG